MKLMSLIWFGLASFLLGLCFLGGVYLYAAVFSLPCFFMAWLTRKFSLPVSRKGAGEWNQEDVDQ